MSARSSLNFPSEFTQVPLNTSSPGPLTLISGIAGQRIKVFRMKMIVGAASIVEFFDGPNLLDVLNFPQAGTMVLDFNTIDMPAWYQTSIGNSFVMTNSGGVQLSGNFDYLISGGIMSYIILFGSGTGPTTQVIGRFVFLGTQGIYFFRGVGAPVQAGFPPHFQMT